MYILAYKTHNLENKVLAGIELINLDWNKYSNKVIKEFSKETKSLQLFIQNLKSYTQNLYVRVFRVLLDDGRDLPKEVYLDILSYNIVKRWFKKTAIVKKYIFKEKRRKIKNDYFIWW